ncbi:MAG: site-specific integrase [Acutalibacteraceae bacterium]
MNDYRREFERFLCEQKKLSEETRMAYLGDHSGLAAFACQKKIDDLAELTASELNAFARWLSSLEKLPATVNRAIAAARCRRAGAFFESVWQTNESSGLLEAVEAICFSGGNSRFCYTVLTRYPILRSPQFAEI